MTSKATHSGERPGDEIKFGSMQEADKTFVVDALQRGANRRQVVAWLVAMGATAAAAGNIVTSATQAIAATPKKGGTVRYASSLHGPSDTLDPPAFTSSIDYCRGRLIYNNLCRLQEDLTAGPELAESFEANPTATEWMFKLRKDVEWHDGSKFTADDVIYSMMRHIGEKSTSNAKVLVGSVKEWIKDDAHTVRAVLNSPNAELPVVLGTFHFKIIKNGTTDFKTAVGTGPYTLKEFSPGVRSAHVRNDNYWNEGGPYIDSIEVFGITDAVARVNALRAGDVQMIDDVNPKVIPQIESTDGVEPFIVPSGTYNGIVIRQDKGPAQNNPDFIQGMKYLQRRDRILKVILQGHGAVGNDHPIAPAYGASHCKELEIGAYDPDKAKFHLKKSGVTTAEMKVAEVAAGLSDTSLLLQREAAKIGFNLQVKKVPNDGYWGAIWNKDPFHVTSWNMRPSANIMMTLAYKSDAPWNESAWKDEKFDKILLEARGELDAKKRYDMNCELQAMIAKGAGTLIPVHRAYIDAKSTKVKGFPKVPIEAFGGMEWPEFIWLDG